MAQRKGNLNHQHAYIQRQEELGRKPRRIFTTDEEYSMIKRFLKFWRGGSVEEYKKLIQILMDRPDELHEKSLREKA